MGKIDHTFAILAFGNSPYLEECIQSIIRQSLLDQVIICTSTPTQLIQALSDKYQIRLCVNQNSNGISDDWNYALEKSKTQFVTLAHQDDIYCRDYLSKCSTYFVEKFSILFPNYYDLDEINRSSVGLPNRVKSVLLWPFLVSKKINNTFLKSMVIRFGNPIGCPGVIYNLDLIENLKFSSRFEYNLDWFAWYQLLKCDSGFYHISDRLYSHRHHLQSVTAVSLKRGKKQTEDFEMFRLFWGNKISTIIHSAYRISYDFPKRKIS